MPIRKGKYAKLLIPLSYMYRLGVSLRNLCFDNGILKSESYPIPIICVGNIAVGGTGKTPHVEYILRIISRTKKVAVVSRGYKRKTKGLVIATKNSTPRDIGDEPYQIMNKFPNVKVVVDANRRRAIRHLLALKDDKRPDVILLDDGFQHRYVKPSFSILLQDYSNPMKTDSMLPYGNLREKPSARFRCDCIIVTKCPEDIKPIEYRIMERDLNLYPHQRVFFSSIRYHRLKKISNITLIETYEDISKHTKVIAVAGIADPNNMLNYIAKHYGLVEELIFNDHHNFTAKDLRDIEDALYYHKENYDNTIIITSEKDAVRLNELRDSIDEAVFDSIYYLPIEVMIRLNRKEFDRMIYTTACKIPKLIK